MSTAEHVYTMYTIVWCRKVWWWLIVSWLLAVTRLLAVVRGRVADAEECAVVGLRNGAQFTFA